MDNIHVALNPQPTKKEYLNTKSMSRNKKAEVKEYGAKMKKKVMMKDSSAYYGKGSVHGGLT